MDTGGLPGAVAMQAVSGGEFLHKMALLSWLETTVTNLGGVTSQFFEQDARRGRRRTLGKHFAGGVGGHSGCPGVTGRRSQALTGWVGQEASGSCIYLSGRILHEHGLTGLINAPQSCSVPV